MTLSFRGESVGMGKAGNPKAETITNLVDAPGLSMS